MDKLVITVTTDSTGSYPRNPYLTPCTDARGVAEEYLRALDAGAAVVHTHGAYTHDPVIQPDGRKLSIPDMEGWRDISERIRARFNPIMQFGMASMRLEQKLELWETLRPDMSSINFNSHDEYFQPDPEYPPFSVYSVHPITELRQYARLAKERGVKLEIECFSTGAYWAIGKIRSGDFWTDEGSAGAGTRPAGRSLVAHPFLRLGRPELVPAHGAVPAVHGGQPSAQCQLEHELHGAAGLLVDGSPYHCRRGARAHRHGGLSLPGGRGLCQNERRAGGEGRAHCQGNRQGHRLAGGSPADRGPVSVPGCGPAV